MKFVSIKKKSACENLRWWVNMVRAWHVLVISLNQSWEPSTNSACILVVSLIKLNYCREVV